LETLVQSQLEEFLNGASRKPYRELIQYHIKRTAMRDLQKAVLAETQMLPANLRRFVMEYIDATNSRFGFDETFWAQATCRQAFDAIIDVAINTLPIRDRISSVTDALKPSNHVLALQLFQIPTLSFAYSGSTQRKQRKFMGIRKGIFG
jgi:hypothetical protein